MDPQFLSLSLSLELKITRARNINLNSSQGLFIRCYLPAGTNKRIKLDTQQISSKSNMITFNQTFSLDCLGTKHTIECLKQETIVFELRRSAPFIIGRMINGSRLLARAEMPWSDVIDMPNMDIEKWVVMVPQIGSRVYDDVIKPPAILIAVNVEESAEVIERKKLISEWDENCGCKSCVEYEFFAIEAGLEVF